MLPAPIELMKLQLHRQFPYDGEGLVWTKRYLVLLAQRGKCVRNCPAVNAISPELVLRDLQQNYSHKPHEISAFDPELVLRDVPGKLA